MLHRSNHFRLGVLALAMALVSGCGSTARAPAAEAQFVFVKIGSEVYEIPTAHKPLAEARWKTSAALNDIVQSGEGTEGSPINLAGVDLQLEADRGGKASAALIRISPISRVFPVDRRAGPVALAASEFTLTMDRPEPISDVFSIQEAKGELTITAPNGDFEKIPFSCGYAPEGTAPAAPLYLNCFLSMKIPGENWVRLQLTPGSDPHRITQLVRDSLILVKSFASR